MTSALMFTRTLFMVLSIVFLTFYKVSGEGGCSFTNLSLGIMLGASFGFALMGIDRLFKQFNLRSFNIAVVGLFFGYFMGQALVLSFSTLLGIASLSIQLSPPAIEILEILLLLFGMYLGTVMTLRAADELSVSIPFIKFTTTGNRKKDLLIDASLLSDVRLIDLAASGLLDRHLILPRFIVKDLCMQMESLDENIRLKAKRSLDVIKKLESILELELRYNDTDFTDVKDFSSKMARLARLLDANILTADMSQLQILLVEGLRFISIHDLSKALKPLTQMGEHIRIKIQRYGKEPRQGVGYLDDGTMVVVNGGGDFIGEIIGTQVLSVKHTTSGRMIFCNAMEEKNSELCHTHEHHGE